MAMDVNCACSGFVYAADMARRYLATDEDLKYVLVVSTETLSKIVDYTDRSTCILFGDGAAACVFERNDEGAFASFLGADGDGAKFLCARALTPDNPFMPEEKFNIEDDMPEGAGSFLSQDGREVYKFAVNALPAAVTNALSKSKMDISEIDWFIPHQANARIIETAFQEFRRSAGKIPCESSDPRQHLFGKHSPVPCGGNRKQNGKEGRQNMYCRIRRGSYLRRGDF